MASPAPLFAPVVEGLLVGVGPEFVPRSEFMNELAGVIVGLAVYNGHALDLRLPKVAYKKLLGEKIGLADLPWLARLVDRGLASILA